MFWKSKKNRAAVFVDYEFWYLSVKKAFNLEPNITAWRREVEAHYPLSEFFFFADISKNYIAEELPRIRAAGLGLIEAPSGRGLTEAVLLDHLYQKAMDKKSPKTFILLVGNGHYEPVINTLTQRCKKQVFLYGVRGSTSNYLKTVASKYQLLPSDQELFEASRHLIIHEYNILAKDKPYINLSFLGMTSLVSSKHSMPEGIVTGAMERMISEGLLERKNYIERVGATPRRIVTPVWDKLIELGLFTP